jgi:hypothetical protein
MTSIVPASNSSEEHVSINVASTNSFEEHPGRQLAGRPLLLAGDASPPLSSPSREAVSATNSSEEQPGRGAVSAANSSEEQPGRDGDSVSNWVHSIQ